MRSRHGFRDVVILSRVAGKRVYTCFYLFPAFTIATVSAPWRAGVTLCFRSRKCHVDKGLISHAQARSLSLQIFDRPSSASNQISSSGLCYKLMTDNLHVDSRRCASIYPQITAPPTAPEATPHLGFRDTCIADHRERAIFYSLPGCPRIQ